MPVLPSTKLCVHVIHAKYLTGRVQVFEALLGRLSESELLSSVEIVDVKDPNELSPQDLEQFTTQPIPGDNKLAYFNAAIKPMSPAQLSNCLKHKLALASIARAKDEASVHLVVEDDVLFNDKLIERLVGAIEIFVKRRLGILFLGIPSSPVEETTVRPLGDAFKVLPCCESFLIDQRTASTLMNDYEKIRFPNNLQLSFALFNAGIDVKMIAPYIFIDGTKLGALDSNVEPNNRLVFNPVYVRLSSIVDKTDPMTPEELEHALELFRAFEFKSNPEIFYLRAKFETKRENFEFARALYKFAYKQYEASGVSLAQGSEFMKDYMKLYREMQPPDDTDV